MDLQEKVIHVMQLDSEHEGTEIFVCPECGRMMFVERAPKFKTKTVEPGDQTAQHLAIPQNAKL